MVNAVSSESVPSAEDQRARLTLLLRAQAQDPTFFGRLAQLELQKDWDDMPSARRDAVATAMRYMYPEDLAGRERATTACLLAMGLLEQLDVQVETLTVSNVTPNTVA
jgi:hypothetical protein